MEFTAVEVIVDVRLVCPDHGVVVEQVPYASYGARLTRDVDDLVAWLATKTDKGLLPQATPLPQPGHRPRQRHGEALRAILAGDLPPEQVAPRGPAAAGGVVFHCASASLRS